MSQFHACSVAESRMLGGNVAIVIIAVLVAIAFVFLYFVVIYCLMFLSSQTVQIDIEAMQRFWTNYACFVSVT